MCKLIESAINKEYNIPITTSARCKSPKWIAEYNLGTLLVQQKQK
jgi:hypothetical protein